MTSITCPRCGATIVNRGVSHAGAGSQWECRCGWIGQDRGDPALDEGTDQRPRATRPAPTEV